MNKERNARRDVEREREIEREREVKEKQKNLLSRK